MIRQLRFSEIKELSELGDKIYSQDLYESYDSVISKFNFYYQGIYGYFKNNKMIGYIISHPWWNDVTVQINPVPLNHIISKPPKLFNCYYIHDVAILPEYRNLNCARELIETVIDNAVNNKFDKFVLIAVNDSTKFWEKFGFSKIDEVQYGKAKASRMSCHI